MRKFEKGTVISSPCPNNGPLHLKSGQNHEKGVRWPWTISFKKYMWKVHVCNKHFQDISERYPMEAMLSRF